MQSKTNLKISLVMVVLLVGIHCRIAVGTEPYVIADDMEGYNDRSDIREVWTDGYHNVVWGTDDYTVVQGGSSGSNLNVSTAVGGYGPGGVGPLRSTPLNYEAMVLRYDNDGYTYTGLPGLEKWVYNAPYYSEIEANTVGTNSLDVGRNWNGEGFTSLSMWFQGHPISDGDLDTNAWPMHTIYGRGRGIQGRYDEFYYLSQYPLTSSGYIQVHVLRMDSTDPLAKAGVMIREKWTPYSKHASVFITPSSGVTFSYRNSEDGPTISITKPGVTAPQYLRLVRIINGAFAAYHSDNGFIWHDVIAPGSEPVFPIIPMGTVSDPGIYIGSVVTSGNSGQICSVDFENFMTTPSLPGWVLGNIGTNDPERLYVALEDSAGNVGVVRHNDINAATLTTWQKWNIPLTDFTGVNLNSVKKIHIGLGDRDAPVQGGSGALYIDDIRLCRPLFVDADAPAGGNGSSWAEAFNDLQDALALAQTGDEIRVAQGIYKPAGYVPPPPPPPPPPPMGDSNEQEAAETTDDREATFQLKNGVVIKGGYAGFGEPNPNARDIKLYETILSGDLLGNDGPDFANNGENSYHVVTGSGTNDTALLDGFTITAGNANGFGNIDDSGGGMYNYFGSPTLNNCTFSGNSAVRDGGGMFNSEQSNPTLTDCTFTGNSAIYDGGAMFNRESSPTVTNCTFSANSANHGGGISNWPGSPILTACTFSGNSAELGGAVFNWESNPTLTNCIFANNSAREWGGAICNLYASSPTLANCTFNSNEANVNGGGMFNSECSPTLINCTFIRNSASAGGGMYNQESDPALTNCIFSENSAVGKYGDGAGMHNNESSPRLTNCTFAGNKADRYGGAMNSYRYATPTLINCILWDDTPEEIYVYGRMPLVTYSNVQGGWPGQGNIDADPCFVEVGYLAPISYWKFDEAGGTTAHDSVGANHGNVHGAQWTTGKINGALSFDGDGDYVEVDAIAPLAGDTLTAQAWIQLDEFAGMWNPILTQVEPSMTNDGYYLYLSNGKPNFYVMNGINYSHAISPESINVNQWYHVAATNDGSTLKLYVNGLLKASVSSSGFTGINHNAYIGYISAINLYYKGLIDDVRIYDRALSADEIWQVYESRDYSLLPNSPCINAGDPDYIAGPDETDLDGNPRVIGGRIDMGAYEFNHIPVADAGPDRAVEAQGHWGATVTLDGSGSSDADSTPGTNDDINDFNWYKLDPCDPNDDVFLGNGWIIDCNLPIGEHIIVLEVIDKVGASDTNEVTIIVQDTTPPDINCPPDVTLECPADTTPSATGKATATDTCGTVTITHSDQWQPGCGNAGTLARTWTATDESGNSSTCVQIITVVDTTPPTITCPPNVTLECPADTSVEANGSAIAGDTCGTVTITHSDQWQPSCGNTGILTRTWTATDNCGNSSTCVQIITVVDTTPPQFEFSVAPTMLWPPDHKMVLITPSWTVSDECDPTPDVSLIGIVANEGDNTIGDGHTSNDIQIGDDGSIYLRSERSGTSDDRVYTITYQAIDDCGNTTVRSATVSIPHDFKLLARMGERWLWSNPSGRIPEDLNGDGIVNLADFARFAENWIR